MLCFLGKGENLQKSAKISENLRLDSVCPLRFVPLSAPRPTVSPAQGLEGRSGVQGDFGKSQNIQWSNILPLGLSPQVSLLKDALTLLGAWALQHGCLGRRL